MSDWKHSYEPSTLFIGKNHPDGGKQSVLVFSSRVTGDRFGEQVANLLNELDEDCVSEK